MKERDKSLHSSNKLQQEANRFNASGIKGAFVCFAKEARNNKIDPEDIKMTIEAIKRVRMEK